MKLLNYLFIFDKIDKSHYLCYLSCVKVGFKYMIFQILNDIPVACVTNLNKLYIIFFIIY